MLSAWLEREVLGLLSHQRQHLQSLTILLCIEFSQKPSQITRRNTSVRGCLSMLHSKCGAQVPSDPMYGGVGLRAVAHLRDGDYGPRPHQLIDRCPCQKQKPSGDHDSNIDDEPSQDRTQPVAHTHPPIIVAPWRRQGSSARLQEQEPERARMPSLSATFKLRISSSLVACWTGRFASSSPLSTRPV
jgi:hypothetical protein